MWRTKKANSSKGPEFVSSSSRPRVFLRARLAAITVRSRGSTKSPIGTPSRMVSACCRPRSRDVRSWLTRALDGVPNWLPWSREDRERARPGIFCGALVHAPASGLHISFRFPTKLRIEAKAIILTAGCRPQGRPVGLAWFCMEMSGYGRLATLEDLLTPEEVAGRLRLSRRTIIGWLQDGRIAGLKVGNRWRIRADQVDSLIVAPSANEDVE